MHDFTDMWTLNYLKLKYTEIKDSIVVTRNKGVRERWTHVGVSNNVHVGWTTIERGCKEWRLMLIKSHYTEDIEKVDLACFITVHYLACTVGYSSMLKHKTFWTLIQTLDTGNLHYSIHFGWPCRCVIFSQDFLENVFT